MQKSGQHPGRQKGGGAAAEKDGGKAEFPNLRQAGHGVQVSQHRLEIAGKISIMIPSQFYGARRDEQTQELLKALQTDRPIAPVSVASTCVRDVLAFVYAALEKRPKLDRAIVITDSAQQNDGDRHFKTNAESQE